MRFILRRNGWKSSENVRKKAGILVCKCNEMRHPYGKNLMKETPRKPYPVRVYCSDQKYYRHGLAGAPLSNSRKFVRDSTPVSCIFVYRNTDPPRWGVWLYTHTVSAFCHSVSWKLSSIICPTSIVGRRAERARAKVADHDGGGAGRVIP